MVKQNTLATTTIQVQQSTDYTRLKSQFKLVRYVIPASFHHKTDNYKLMHIELKSQLSVPYLPYQFDNLDKAESMVIYALYPRNETSVTKVILSFISDDTLNEQEIGFYQIGLFNLVKLLQANYFSTFPHFVSMGEYYIHAKSKDNWHTCLEIKIQGSYSNYIDEEEQPIQEFWVTGHAKYFNRPSKQPDEYQKQRFPYYTIQKTDFIVFKQLIPTEIDNHRDELFQQYSNKSNPARLVYHAQKSSGLLPSKAYLLHQFTKRFVLELQNYGISAQRKERTWTQYAPPKQVTKLPKQLSQIYLYDNRKNRAKYPLTTYQELLQTHFKNYEFAILESLEDAQNQPTLIIADTAKRNYEDGGLFFGEEDLYKKITRQYPHIPKQSINVNINSDNEKFLGLPADYLDYSLITLLDPDTNEDDDSDTDEDDKSGESWAMKFQVCLYQLYLKSVVINRLLVSEFLPSTGKLATWTDFIYIRKETYNGNSYHVMMQIKSGQLIFYDLADPAQKSNVTQIMEGWGYDWFDIEDLLLKKYHKKKNKKPEVKNYDLILKPNLAIELETVDETILYKYDEISRRYNVRQEKRHIEELALVPHYDRIRPKNTLSATDLKRLGLLDGRDADGKTETESLAFYNQLESYDTILGEVANFQSKITYDEFVEIRNQEIGRVLKLPTIKGSDPLKYNTKRLLDYYKTIWSIGGFKSDDVQISKGIWFNPEDLAYVVGDVNNFDSKQDTANLVRRFDVLVGDKTHFDMEVFLAATAVQFIRYKQYTVYPYPFYLIDKYIQDMLHHGS